MATYYSEDHEWIAVDEEGDTATVGITGHAAEQLGDIVFVELRDPGEKFRMGDEIGVIESVKAASELYAPVDGEIIEANEALPESPASVNESPEENAWFYRIRIDDVSQLDGLMDIEAYKAFIG